MKIERHFRGLTLALGFVAIGGLAACDDDGSPTGEDTARLSVLLTDEPGDFEQAIVAIERIELMGDDDDIDDELEQDNEDPDTPGGRIVLREDAWVGDLLELQNQVDELVDDAVVPAGDYSQLRFVISGGCIEVETETGSDVYASSGFDACGDADGELHMPSFAQSGLKVNLPDGFDLSSGQRIVLLDFDVSESFGHQAGNSGRWVMHPVIHATEVEFSGGVDIDVTLAEEVELPEELELAAFGIVLDEEDPVFLTDGSASLEYLVPGTYTIDLALPEGFDVTTEPALPLEVTVESGQRVEVDLVITGVETL